MSNEKKSAVETVMERKKARQQADNQPAPDGADEYNFYKIKIDQNGDIKDVQIMQTGFLALLRKLGFRRYDVGDAFEIVRIQSNIIERVPIHRLREIIVRWFTALPEDMPGCNRDMLIEKLHRSLGTLTTDEKLALLVDFENDEPVKLVEDTQDTAFYFYKNGFVEVTGKAITLRPYKDLPGYVWKDQIIQRDYKPFSTLKDLEKGVFWRFANNVSGNKTVDGVEVAPDRFVSLTTILGYNLHRFFNTKLRATIFLDSRITDDPDGRSGKSLLCKALSLILNADPQRGRQAVTIDGKRYDSNNRFNLDELDITTRLVVFDDIKKGFSIEDFFNAIVDGLIRERKGDVNKARILAKLIFTLNYTIQIRGGSAKDRVIEFEIADHYSSQHTPEMEFKHWFFRDWDAAEWANFDNFMMYCVKEYFLAGIIKPDSINLDARKLLDETSKEFIDFMDDLNVEHEKSYAKKELYTKFCDVDSDGNVRRKEFKWMTQRKFTDWLRRWSDYNPQIAGYREERRDSADFIRFFYNMPVTPEMLEVNTKTTVVKLYPDKSTRVKAAPVETDKTETNDVPY